MVPRVPRSISRPVAGADAGTSTGGPLAACGRAQSDEIPASPPAEVLRQVRAAQRMLEELDARGQEVRFDARGRRIRIELRDSDGNVLREIAPSQAVRIAGAAHWLA